MLSKIVLFWHKTTALISERSSSHLYRSSRLENFYQLIFFCTFWLSIIWPGVIPASITSIYLGIWLLLLITRGTVLVDNTSHLSFRSANFRARREPCDAYRSRHLWHPVVLEIVGGRGSSILPVCDFSTTSGIHAHLVRLTKVIPWHPITKKRLTTK